MGCSNSTPQKDPVRSKKPLKPLKVSPVTVKEVIKPTEEVEQENISLPTPPEPKPELKNLVVIDDENRRESCFSVEDPELKAALAASTAMIATGGAWEEWNDLETQGSSSISEEEETPKDALAVLLPSVRAVLVGSVICSANFEEVLHEMGESGNVLRELCEDFTSRLSRSQKRSWEQVLLGSLDPSFENAEEEFGFGCRTGGLLQGDESQLLTFLTKEVGVTWYLYAGFCGNATNREALLEANEVWCKKFGWAQGSSTEVQEQRVQKRLFKVMDWNLDKQYEGKCDEMIRARDSFLSEITELFGSDRTANLQRIDVYLLEIMTICRASMSRVPTNLTADEVRVEYQHIVRVSLENAYRKINKWEAKHADTTISKFSNEVIGLMEGFVALLDHFSFAGGELNDSASLLSPCIIPSSPFDQSRKSTRLEESKKGFESFAILRRVT